MAVLIKRFRVRHNGIYYGPGQLAGQILTGLSEEAEARLIAGSNGTIVKLELESEPVGSESESSPDLEVETTAEEKLGQHAEESEETEEQEQQGQQHVEETEELEDQEEQEQPTQSTSEESGSKAITTDDILNTNLDDLIKPADQSAEISTSSQAASSKNRKRGG